MLLADALLSGAEHAVAVDELLLASVGIHGNLVDRRLAVLSLLKEVGADALGHFDGDEAVLVVVVDRRHEIGHVEEHLFPVPAELLLDDAVQMVLKPVLTFVEAVQ